MTIITTRLRELKSGQSVRSYHFTHPEIKLVVVVVVVVVVIVVVVAKIIIMIIN
jgi:hypothetical protein